MYPVAPVIAIFIDTPRPQVTVTQDYLDLNINNFDIRNVAKMRMTSEMSLAAASGMNLLNSTNRKLEAIETLTPSEKYETACSIELPLLALKVKFR
jgi:hypothetical protein